MPPKVKASVFEKYSNECVFCSASKNLHIHHIDKNRKNNTLKNLLLVCVACHFKCHGRVENKQRKKEVIDLRRKGVSYGCIAAHLKISRNVVGSILSGAMKTDPTISEDAWNHRHDMEIDIISGEIIRSTY